MDVTFIIDWDEDGCTTKIVTITVSSVHKLLSNDSAKVKSSILFLFTYFVYFILGGLIFIVWLTLVKYLLLVGTF